MTDKKSASDDHAKIDFEWERVKKKAQRKLNELKCNAPKISRRQEMEILQKRTTRLVECFNKENSGSAEPFSHIPTMDADGQTVNTSPVGSSNPTQNRAKEKSSNTDPNTEPIYSPNDIDNDMRHGTPSPQLLPAASARPLEETSERRQEERGDIVVHDCGVVHDLTVGDNLGPDKNAVELIRQISEKTLDGRDLAKDERQLVVNTLRTSGQTQDAIAQLLNVSRRTIVSDCKYLRQMAALEIATLETTDLAGRVYTVGLAAIDKALKANKLKTVSTLMRDMVETLQSMGVVYRAPKTSMQANLNTNLNSSRKGYQKYLDTIGQDSDKVVEVLDCVMEHLSKG